MTARSSTLKIKPAYKLPSMADIKAVSWNGFTVASTFSGCGGSSLGYKLAGFRVVWANEFIPAAIDVYRRNHPDTVLDTRDIRKIKPDEILKAAKLREGELDIFDGSPPCASFSMSGDRERHWGKAKVYSDTVQRTDDLFFEYIRLLDGVRPRVFVAENVSGLVKGVAKGYFLEILQALQKCGYRVACKVLDAQWLGVPQARARTIFIGVRDDLKREPVFPKPLGFRYTLREALQLRDASARCVFGNAAPFESKHKPVNLDAPSPTIITHSHQLFLSISRFAIGREWDKLKPGQSSKKFFNLVKPKLDEPCPTICANHGTLSLAGVTHPVQKRKLTIAELKRVCAFPADFVLTGSYTQQWERLGRAVPPLMMAAIARTIRDEVLRKIKR